MKKASLDFLRNLMEQSSPSGYETAAQQVVRHRMQSGADKVWTDVHGNVYGVINESAPLRVMLAGHVDEIGFLVSHADKDGFLNFSEVGGWDLVIATGQRVTIETARGPVAGIIGRKAIHLTRDEEQKKPAIKAEDLWIDIGARSRAEALRTVAIGDPVVIRQDFLELMNRRVAARAFDNRAGAWLVTEALNALSKRDLKVAVYGVSTVQEELGLRGAETSAYRIKPQVGIAVDAGHATDYPDGNERKGGPVLVGKGPVLHRGGNINAALGEHLARTARKHRIATQMHAAARPTGTDANRMQLARGGCAAALISIPNRYMHTPVEVISLEDLERALQLVVEAVAALKGTETFIPGNPT